MQNLSCENQFDLSENEPVGGTDFHTNGFALRPVLIKRQTATRKGLLVFRAKLGHFSLFFLHRTPAKCKEFTAHNARQLFCS